METEMGMKKKNKNTIENGNQKSLRNYKAETFKRNRN